MSRFKFQLDPVLAHRTRLEEERQREFALKQRELAEAEAVRLRLVADRDAHRSAIDRDHSSFTLDRLQATYAHLAYLDREIMDQSVRVGACSAEASRAQALLIAASKERKVLETLKAHRLHAFNAETERVDQRVLDDQNARLFGRAELQRRDPS